MPVPGKVCATLFGVALLLACGAGTASATVVDRGTFSGSENDVPDNVCGIAVLRDTTFSGSFRIRVDKQSDGQAFFQLTNFQSRDVFTNPLNGHTLTFEASNIVNEITATHVEGTVYSFTVIEAGRPFTVRDGAGNVILRDRGVIRHQELFDTLGDGTPGGIQLEDVIVRVGGPHPGLDMSEEEFCATVGPLIG